MRLATAIVVLAAALGMAFYVARSDRPLRQNHTAREWGEPLQLACAQESWKVGTDRITALASYDMKVTVLSTERYWFDNGAHLSPIDFAVGWGPMSNLSLAEQLDIGQGGRMFHYRLPRKGFSLSLEEINRNSANVHLIPKDTAIRDRLLAVRTGDIVTLSGRLVEVSGENGSHWRSSLSRTDSGGGACEVMWVERIDWE